MPEQQLHVRLSFDNKLIGVGVALGGTGLGILAILDGVRTLRGG